MVIEKALEKLRQAGAMASAGGPAAAESPARRTSVRNKPAAVNASPESRPIFPTVECDRAAAVSHRIVLPGTPLAADEHAAAAYRIIRTRLLHTIRSNGLTSIAITSPGAGDGKSVTAINLALNVARDATSSVFLIDLDMRNPSICRYLGVRPPRELLSYFMGEAAPADVFFSIGPQNLAISGSLVSTELASELIGSGHVEALIEYIVGLGGRPIVLIDLPPVLVTDEALRVAPRVDATLLVVAEGGTRRDDLLRARTVLQDFPSAGVILNRGTERIGGGRYYYGYR
jgi:Mrp family chromosome partitioning ATPase